MKNNKKDETMHICLSLHDANGTYGKYVATTICSVLENTKRAVCIHIFCDDTLTYATRNDLRNTVYGHGQSICFHEVGIREWERYESLISMKYMTIGTLFRLKIPDVLPQDIPRAIYLDADIIVHLDIAELWDVDMEGSVLAACRDADGVRWLIDAGMVKRENYFNAGVMVMDVSKMRVLSVSFEQFVTFLQAHPECRYADQDALNYFFQGMVKYLPRKYNQLTFYARLGNMKPESAIYHFAGDYIHLDDMKVCDQLFFSYLLKTPWGMSDTVTKFFEDAAVRHVRQMIHVQKALRRVARPECRRIIFGAQSELNVSLRSFFPLVKGRDYYLDNDKDLQGTVVQGIPVYSPDRLQEESKDDVVVIVLSRQYYANICSQLKELGLQENEQFFDGRELLSETQGGVRFFI